MVVGFQPAKLEMGGVRTCLSEMCLPSQFAAIKLEERVGDS